jgi:hypothetical protein
MEQYERGDEMETATIGQQFAKAVADHITQHMFPPHRGVIEVRNPFGREPLVVAFGNDGYGQDERTRRYADALAHEIAEQGLQGAEMGVDDEGYTWAIVVPIDRDGYAPLYRAAIEDELYAQYRQARDLAADDGFMLARKSICDREIAEHTGGEPLRIEGWESIN